MFGNKFHQPYYILQGQEDYLVLLLLGFCLFWEGSIFFFPSKLKMPFLLGYNNLSTKAPGVVSFHYQASTAGPCTWRYEIHPTFILQCAQ